MHSLFQLLALFGDNWLCIWTFTRLRFLSHNQTVSGLSKVTGNKEPNTAVLTLDPSYLLILKLPFQNHKIKSYFPAISFLQNIWIIHKGD